MNSLKWLSMFAVCTLIQSACNNTSPEPLISNGDRTISVFDSCPIQFDMAWKKNEAPDSAGVIHFDAGRVVLRKIEVPLYEKHVDISVRVSLVSNGDTWDKAGSLFILPGSEVPLFKEIQDGKIQIDTSGYPGIISDGAYTPAIELLRFMTPFGIGHFSDTAKVRPPIYVPVWEEEVTWESDISHLLTSLEGEIWVGCYIDTWTKEGYLVNVDLVFDESEIQGHSAKHPRTMALCNTIKYMPVQEAFDGFHKGPIEIEFEIPDPAKDVRLYYTTTGHGGHETGDEFVKKENRISLDGELISAFTPWRDDCASFRRFNPTSGVWRVKTKNYHDEPEEQSLASSDISRSGWCPGSKADPVVIELENISAGAHTLSIAIPDAQQWIGETNEFNHWLVSAYLTWNEQ